MIKQRFFGLLLAVSVTVGCQLETGGGITGPSSGGGGPGGSGGFGWTSWNPCGGTGCPKVKLSGRVTEGEGVPVESALITILHSGGYTTVTMADTTDADGRYSIEGTTSGDCCAHWPVTATHPSGPTHTDTIQVCGTMNILDFKF